MKKIKTYNLFLERFDNNQIIQLLRSRSLTFDDLGLIEQIVEMKAPGIFNEVCDYVDTIYNSFDLIDFEYLKSATYEIFDEYPECYNKIYFCVFYCNPVDLSRPSDEKWKRVYSANYEESRTKIITEILISFFSEKTTLSKIFDCFKPGILISLHCPSISIKEQFDVDELEKQIDDSLPNILNNIEYDEVVFDYYRGRRQNKKLYTDYYNLKILLKF